MRQLPRDPLHLFAANIFHPEPPALWALHRTVARGRMRDGLLTVFRDRGVDRVVLHERDFPDPATCRTMIAELAKRPGIREVSRALANGGEARLHELGK